MPSSHLVLICIQQYIIWFTKCTDTKAAEGAKCCCSDDHTSTTVWSHHAHFTTAPLAPCKAADCVQNTNIDFQGTVRWMSCISFRPRQSSTGPTNWFTFWRLQKTVWKEMQKTVGGSLFCGSGSTYVEYTPPGSERVPISSYIQKELKITFVWTIIYVKLYLCALSVMNDRKVRVKSFGLLLLLLLWYYLVISSEFMCWMFSGIGKYCGFFLTFL